MPKIVIQAGHVNASSSPDPVRRKQTGAPGEVSFTLDVANQVSAELRKRGFEVKQTDSNADYDTSVTSVDWDLFLAIHYDADVYKDSGGFVDTADPSVDAATKESQRIAKILESEYFSKTGIKNVPSRSNGNTQFYYMWSSLSAKTPCVIIECGVGWRVPEDSDILNSDKRSTLVVPGIVKGICRAFNIPYEIAPNEIEDLKKQLEEAENKISRLQNEITRLQEKIDNATAALA